MKNLASDPGPDQSPGLPFNPLQALPHLLLWHDAEVRETDYLALVAVGIETLLQQASYIFDSLHNKAVELALLLTR